MTPDIEQHLELLAVILAVTLGILNRLLKRRNGRLRLTLSVTEESSSDLHPNTKTSEADGKRTDLSEHKQQHIGRRENE
jgi:hypothetical protein